MKKHTFRQLSRHERTLRTHSPGGRATHKVKKFGSPVLRGDDERTNKKKDARARSVERSLRERKKKKTCVEGTCVCVFVSPIFYSTYGTSDKIYIAAVHSVVVAGRQKCMCYGFTYPPPYGEIPLSA